MVGILLAPLADAEPLPIGALLNAFAESEKELDWNSNSLLVVGTLPPKLISISSSSVSLILPI